MGLKITQKGDFHKSFRFLRRRRSVQRIMKKYGAIGVNELVKATPKRTSETANSWYYEIREDSEESSTLYFCNANVNEGVPIAIIIQYGHGTSTGGWVEGIDYINPALKPIFDDLSEKMRKEVSSD